MLMKIAVFQKAIQPVGLYISLSILFLVLSACESPVQFVPAASLAPAPTEVISTANNVPEVSTVDTGPNRIEAEVIGLNAPVVAMGWRVIEQGGEFVSEWEMPDSEAAWHRNSARPGEGSNIVISGHNESTGGQVFAEVEELQVGDEITLWDNSEESFVYQVVEKSIIRTFVTSAKAQDYLRTVVEPTNTEQLTLITCWPRWTNTHRLIVIAAPKPVETSAR